MKVQEKKKNKDTSHFSLMFPTLKRVQLSKRAMEVTHPELMQARAKITEDFGLTKTELMYVASRRPDMLLYGTKYEQEGKGMTAIKEVFIDKLKMEKELIRTLLVKYPHIISAEKTCIENSLTFL